MYTYVRSSHNYRVVKLTSPNINYFIIAGAYCNYISIYSRVLPSTDYTVTFVTCFVSMCAVVPIEDINNFLQIDSTINTIGYSLAFSAILVKMGRVYYIFHNPSLGKKVFVKSFTTPPACNAHAISCVYADTERLEACANSNGHIWNWCRVSSTASHSAAASTNTRSTKCHYRHLFKKCK